MLDNATSNDVCVKLLSRQFDYAFAPIERRLRCFGHIVNLVVKALLFGKNCEIFEKDVNFAYERQDESKQLIEWRKRGPVKKLHNIVTRIRTTPQRIAFFKSLQRGAEEVQSLLVISDNDTRWNSTYNMLESTRFSYRNLLIVM